MLEIAQNILWLLILIGVIAGSRLRPQAKRRVETWFLMPLFVLSAAGFAAFAARERAWMLVAFFALVCAVATERLVKRLREPHA